MLTNCVDDRFEILVTDSNVMVTNILNLLASASSTDKLSWLQSQDNPTKSTTSNNCHHVDLIQKPKVYARRPSDGLRHAKLDQRGFFDASFKNKNSKLFISEGWFLMWYFTKLEIRKRNITEYYTFCGWLRIKDAVSGYIIWKRTWELLISKTSTKLLFPQTWSWWFSVKFLARFHFSVIHITFVLLYITF